MKLRNSIIALFLCLACAASAEITHEDIKDAMLSLVHMMRENTEKLERHEARDRQTAEQLKKSMALLVKRMSTVDGLKAYIEKLEDRVAGVEQLIQQKDERERIQLQKTADTVEDLENRLEGWATEIETKVIEGTNKANAAIVDRSPDILARIEASETKLNDRVQRLEDAFAGWLAGLPVEVQTIGAKIKEVSDLLSKLDGQASLKESSRDAASAISSASVDEQVRILRRLQDLLENTLEQVRNMPRISELHTMHNETQMSLQEARHALKDAIVVGNERIESRMNENKEESRDKMTSLKSDMANNAERISQELHDLSKSQGVMVEMADHVLDTKKRLEHAYKIIREVGELVQAQGHNINRTLNSRFDGISNDIMDNQNGALANLTVKMEQEMNQVWRQINVMYQQMMESAKALDKLHEQNEAYVNGTTSTMDGMESKVGEITKRMSEVDTNLNYLLGRLSLVTQEFNQIKTGLGAALDNIKESFKAVQEKANEFSSGDPGPHPLPQDYREPDAAVDQSQDPAMVNLPEGRHSDQTQYSFYILQEFYKKTVRCEGKVCRSTETRSSVRTYIIIIFCFVFHNDSK
uniref:Paramyosin n=1 Tax=Trichogramma kaykai TaxID=54128 RepID=A0ABD2XGL1_9HYME